MHILQKLKCLDTAKSNIVRCHDWFTFLDQAFLVFELLDISLYDYMAKTKRAPLPLHGIRTIIKDVRASDRQNYLKLSCFYTLAHP